MQAYPPASVSIRRPEGSASAPTSKGQVDVPLGQDRRKTEKTQRGHPSYIRSRCVKINPGVRSESKLYKLRQI